MANRMAGNVNAMIAANFVLAANTVGSQFRTVLTSQGKAA